MAYVGARPSVLPKSATDCGFPDPANTPSDEAPGAKPPANTVGAVEVVVVVLVEVDVVVRGLVVVVVLEVLAVEDVSGLVVVDVDVVLVSFVPTVEVVAGGVVLSSPSPSPSWYSATWCAPCEAEAAGESGEDWDPPDCAPCAPAWEPVWEGRSAQPGWRTKDVR